MAKFDPPVVLRHQVLADPTGRRRRSLAIAGRVATTALGLWLVALLLGGLGLQPLAGLPVVGDLGAGQAAPPTLPKRVQTAVATRTTVAPATPAVQVPVTNVPVPSHQSAGTAPSNSKTRPEAGTTPSTAPGHTKTPPGRGSTTNSSTTAPGQTKTSPGQTKTPPGQTKTPPGQTKTGPGPPASTPDKTPGGKGKSTTP